ncbi:MAG: proline--tRNA ligase [Candidatus Micrarchaeia archaeon]
MAKENGNVEKMMLTAKKEENFSDWYQQVIINSEFADYSAVSGMIVFRPMAYFAWDTIRSATSELFKKSGILDVYFPLFIPERFLEKEKEHVEGFSPEVAWVTHAGKSKLDERLAVRPTSETIMYPSFAKWIRSWRDLPMRYNQWNSVVRWEFKHPTPFLRSREFLWNEGHTVFATREDAEAERDVILGIYAKILKEYLALPGIPGKKTDKEKFAGAEASYSIEHMMPDGWAIQGPDFHNDGQNFAKAFGIKFLDKDGNVKFAYQNTFAISTRELGVMIAVHGDNKGLVIPPKLALIQAVIIPIYNNSNREEVIAKCNELKEKIGKKIRAYIDDNEAYSPGWKFNEWELKGVPVRIEIGGKEAKEGFITVVRRDTLEKSRLSFEKAEAGIEKLLESIHESMYERAEKFMQEHIKKVSTMEELKKAVQSGNFAQAPWCGSMECEDKIKEETGAKATNMPFKVQEEAKGKKCIYCGKDAHAIVNFARSY